MGWMGPHRNLSLRQKLRLIGIAASTTATVLTCVIFLQQEVRDFGPDVVRRLSSLAEIVGANSTAALVFGDPEAAEEILAGLVSQPSIHSACLYGPDGEPFATFVRPGSDRRFRPPGVRILTIRRLTPAEPFRDVAALTGALRVWSVPRVRGSPRRGKFVGLVRSPRSRIAPVRHVRRFLPFPTFADRPVPSITGCAEPRARVPFIGSRPRSSRWGPARLRTSSAAGSIHLPGAKALPGAGGAQQVARRQERLTQEAKAGGP